jgi:branched-chain amino acid transport system substrate-binding protein
MMKRAAVAVVLSLGMAALVASAQAASRPTAKVPPCGATLGLIAPITGPAATIGQEIKNWTRLAVANWNKARHTRYTLFEADTQLNPAAASTIAQQFVSNRKIVATVGPAASQEVVAAGPTLNRAHLAIVSPTATLTSLTTDGKLHNFFRVVARDDTQAPTAANYIIRSLHAKTVMIVDDQSSFSTGLAASATTVLQKAGVSVDRESVSQTATDFSALIAKVGADNLVFLTWQLPANIKLFIQQLHAQGKTNSTFATTFDGGTDFVSSFSINVHTYAPDAALRRQYEDKYGTNYTGQFGPPSYVSAQVLMSAIDSLCVARKPVTRPNVLAAVRKVRIPHSILGRTIAFDKRGDVVNGRFYIYKLVNGTYQLAQ